MADPQGRQDALIRQLQGRVKALEDAGGGGGSGATAKVYRDTDQTTGIPFVEFSDVAYDTPGGSWTVGDPTKLFVPDAGIYRVMLGAAVELSGAGQAFLSIMRFDSTDTPVELSDNLPADPSAGYTPNVAYLQVALECEADAGDYFVGIAAANVAITEITSLVPGSAPTIYSPWMSYALIA